MVSLFLHLFYEFTKFQSSELHKLAPFTNVEISGSSFPVQDLPPSALGRRPGPRQESGRSPGARSQAARRRAAAQAEPPLYGNRESVVNALPPISHSIG